MGWITCPFQNINGGVVEVSKWISNFTPYFIINIIIHSFLDLSNMSVKDVPGGGGPIPVQFCNTVARFLGLDKLNGEK